jgi:hypothetical protein
VALAEPGEVPRLSARPRSPSRRPWAALLLFTMTVVIPLYIAYTVNHGMQRGLHTEFHFSHTL